MMCHMRIYNSRASIAFTMFKINSLIHPIASGHSMFYQPYNVLHTFLRCIFQSQQAGIRRKDLFCLKGRHRNGRYTKRPVFIFSGIIKCMKCRFRNSPDPAFALEFLLCLNRYRGGRVQHGIFRRLNKDIRHQIFKHGTAPGKAKRKIIKSCKWASQLEPMFCRNLSQCNCRKAGKPGLRAKHVITIDALLIFPSVNTNRKQFLFTVKQAGEIDFIQCLFRKAIDHCTFLLNRKSILIDIAECSLYLTDQFRILFPAG